MSTDPPLRRKDPSLFRSKHVLIKEEQGYVLVRPSGDVHSFGAMQSHRQSCAPEVIHNDLLGQGHEFANLGISAVVNTNTGGSTYSLVVKRDRHKDTGFSDVVFKLISGYLDASFLDDPQLGIMEELGEECIIQQGGVVLPVFVDGISCGKPFEGRIMYSSHACGLTSNDSQFSVPDLSPKRIVMVGARDNLLRKSAQVYYHSPTNSAQIVFHYDLVLPGGVSLHHTEEQLDVTSQSLDTYLYRNGMMLLQTHGSALTGQIVALDEGMCVVQDPKGAVLSEAFARKLNHICSRKNASLDEAVQNQARSFP